MKRYYGDILSRIPEAPTFFEMGGVPRWGEFTPRESADPYAQEVALVEISCQLCDTRFNVLFEHRSHHQGPSIAETIDKGELRYRDPPNVGCCDSGATMSSETVRVVEYWTRDGGEFHTEWQRHPAKEVAFRRIRDPWTPEMRARAQAMIDDPEAPAEHRQLAAEALAWDDARRTELNLPAVGGNPSASDPLPIV